MTARLRLILSYVLAAVLVGVFVSAIVVGNTGGAIFWGVMLAFALVLLVIRLVLPVVPDDPSYLTAPRSPNG